MPTPEPLVELDPAAEAIDLLRKTGVGLSERDFSTLHTAFSRYFAAKTQEEQAAQLSVWTADPVDLILFTLLIVLAIRDQTCVGSAS